MNNKKLTLVASIGLSVYALYKIISYLSLAFAYAKSDNFIIWTMLLSLLIISISSWTSLALGLCGLILAFEDSNKNSNDSLKRIVAVIKKFAFLTFIALSTCSLFVMVYKIFSDYKKLEYVLANGYNIGNRFILINYINVAFSILIYIGGILFGLYVITKREKLIKPFMVIYFTGFTFSLLLKTYSFINAIIEKRMMTVNTLQLGFFAFGKNQLIFNISSYLSSILILTAGLIIVLYGIKKEKLPVTEDVN